MKRPLKGSSILTLSLLSLLILTNRYLSISEEPQLIPPDSFSYLKVASEFPSLPPHDANLPFHHAQRFIFPYLVGAFSKLSNISLEATFRAFALFAIFGIVLLLKRILGSISKLSDNQISWIMALLILNPYSFRIYIAAPYLLNDIFFQLGFALLLAGLWEESSLQAVVGILIASCSRQTALPLIFPTFLWLGILWPAQKRNQIYITGACSILISSGVYFVTAKVAATFSGPNQNFSHIIGLVLWLKKSFSLKILLEFALRGLIGLTLLISTVVAIIPDVSKFETKDKMRAVCLLAFSVLVAAQPVLGGPAVTGQDITRLILLGLFPLLILLGVLFSYSNLKPSYWAETLPLAIAFAAASSLHHMYSFLGVGNGSERTFAFALVHFGCGMLLLLALKAAKYMKIQDSGNF
jgi:hypothetical protein